MVNPRHLLLFLAFLFPTTQVIAQPKEQPVISIKRATSKITIDGALDEEAWKDAQKTTPFVNKWPSDSGYAVTQTEARMLFDNQFIYIAAISYQDKKDLIIQTLKRDQLIAFWNSDGFSVVLDPIGQKSTGYLFGVNAGGAQLDGAINLVGTWAQMNENWDNKWYSAVTVHDDYWVVEIAIPFTALRFRDASADWSVNFIRNDMKNNVYSTWSRVPLQLNGFHVGHMGTMRWAEPVTPEKSKITLIPYLSGGHGRNHEDGENTKTNGNAGIDMKVALTSSLNLDLTYRPDFSNVEVDRQMTNLTRFSLLYPERRNFFLENADLFTNFGSWLTKPFFSRRIGLQDGDPIPIAAGARLSGNITRSLRVGVMDVQTEATHDYSANNYLVAAFQHQVLARSNIKIFGANRQTTKTMEDDPAQDYNRTMGAEFQYVSKSGKLSGYLRAHTAQTPERSSQNHYVSSQINYLTSKFYAGGILERVGENYVNDLGFIPRLYNYDAVRDTTVRIGHSTFNPWFGLLIYPKKSKRINLIEPNTWSVLTYRTSGEFLERNTSVNLGISFKDTRQFYVEAFNTDVNLPYPADIIDSDRPIPVARYNFTQYTVKYSTDSRKALSGNASIGYGDFYNGTRLEYGASLNFRKQPWGVFGVTFLQNNIHLPEEYGNACFQLIGPRAEISFRNNVWWTTFLQYNTQEKNFNVNSRFQWRFRPMSDFFIVYTDNYATTDMKVKNRGVVMKITYWLNL
jgi:hypothetical protein